MELIRDSLFFTHILFGSLSLVFFWIPAFAKKGSGLHIKAGKAYLLTMAVTVFTAAILSIIIISFTDRTALGLFLGFLSLITANPLFFGWTAFKPKPWHVKVQVLIESLIGLYGLILILLGLKVGSGANMLFFFFGGLGILTVLGTLVKAIKRKPISRQGISEHVNGMLFSGGAAYTAFLSFGAREVLIDVLPGMWQLIPWIAPTFVAAIAASLFQRKYKTQRA